jgi:hypothetical protein
MALANTTLSLAVATTDQQIVVASATSFAAGRIVRIDNEIMQVRQDYVSGTTVPVLRGRDGSAVVAHVITTTVTHGLASDFAAPAAQTVVQYPNVRPTMIVSVTSTGTLTLPPAGSDYRVIFNGTGAITLTIPVPTKDLDGTMMLLVSNGAAAHIPTFTGGLGGAGSSYDAITNNATGRFALLVVAANETWQIVQAPALTGTVTNITGGIA